MSLTTQRLDELDRVQTAIAAETGEPYPEYAALIQAARLQVAIDELPLLPPCPDDEDRSTWAQRPHIWTVKLITSPWMNGTPNWAVFAVCKGSHKGWAPQVKGAAPTMLLAVLALGDALRSRT